MLISRNVSLKACFLFETGDDMKKIGFLTIGQSLRTDVTGEIRGFLPENVEIEESGALDGLGEKEIKELWPEEGEEVLVSRLKNGGFTKMGEKKIIPLMEERIRELEKRGVTMAVVLCTGKFPDLKSDIPLIYPQRLLYKTVPLFTRGKCIATVNPSRDQFAQSEANWGKAFCKVIATECNPYGYKGEESAASAAEIIRDSDAELVVADCIGYTGKMKADLEKLTGKTVVLPRILVASIVGELL